MPRCHECHQPNPHATHGSIRLPLSYTHHCVTAVPLEDGFVLVPAKVFPVTSTTPSETHPVRAAHHHELCARHRPQMSVELPNDTSSIAQEGPPAVAGTYRYHGTCSFSIPTTETLDVSTPASSQWHADTPLLPYSPGRSKSTTARMSQQRAVDSIPDTNVLRRSTSSRPASSSSTSTSSRLTSYVASLREQKATVWCFQQQSIGTRNAAQQKTIKKGAVLGVLDSISRRATTITTNNVWRTNRHASVSDTAQCTSPNTMGIHVPARLLALDTYGEDGQARQVPSNNGSTHSRTRSASSSLGSATYRSGYRRASLGATMNDLPAHEESPEAWQTPSPVQGKEEYSNQARKIAGSSSGDSVESHGENTAPSMQQHTLRRKARENSLRGRGSLDEGKESMRRSGLFVANPDVIQV